MMHGQTKIKFLCTMFWKNVVLLPLEYKSSLLCWRWGQHVPPKR